MFEKYAKENSFDPLTPENWYAQSKQKLLQIKVFLYFFNFFKLCLSNFVVGY